jgi:hypothetical protein
MALDLDLDLSDDEAVAERRMERGSRRTLVGGSRVGYEPIFQDEDEERQLEGQNAEPVRKPLDVGGNRGRETLADDDEEMWDRLT